MQTPPHHKKAAALAIWREKRAYFRFDLFLCVIPHFAELCHSATHATCRLLPSPLQLDSISLKLLHNAPDQKFSHGNCAIKTASLLVETQSPQITFLTLKPLQTLY